MNDESGFSTPFAMAVIFSLSLMAMSFSLFAASSNRKINSYGKSVASKKELESVTRLIEKEMQVLKYQNADFDAGRVAELLDAICNYEFTVRDVSTGINRNFVSEKFIENDAVRAYMASFEEESFVNYGWVNSKLAGQSVIEDVVKDFEYEKTFPLVNAMPPFNIHFMNPNFLKAVIEYAGLKDSEKKVDLILGNLNSETTIEEIASLVGVSEGHLLFDLIGLKTTFWQIEFVFEGNRCTATYAAVPRVDSQREVERYMLVERKISSREKWL